MLAKPFTRYSLLAMAAGLGLSWSSVMQPLHAATASREVRVKGLGSITLKVLAGS